MKKIILFHLLCLLSSCNGQDKKTEVKNEQIKAEKRFDIKRFNENKKNGEYIYIDSLGNRVTEITTKRGYGRYVSLKNEFNVKFLYHFFINIANLDTFKKSAYVTVNHVYFCLNGSFFVAFQPFFFFKPFS